MRIIAIGSSFGKQINSNALVSLSEDSILLSNTDLYCITNNRIITDLVWSYEDVSGNSIVLSGSIDTSTGISTLSVSTDVPGYYSCEVSLEGGMKRTYTIEMKDLSMYTGALEFNNRLGHGILTHFLTFESFLTC